MRLITGIIIIIGLLFAGCKSPNSTSGKTYGSLSLNSALSATSSKSLKRDLSSGSTCWPAGLSTSDGFTYTLTLTNSSTSTSQSNTTGSFTVNNLVVGSWTAKVAVTAGSTEVASVTQSLTIASGATTSLSLTPVPADGSGTVTLDWSWPSTASLTPSLVFIPLVTASGTTSTEASSSIASGTQESFTLKTGLYSVTALLTNASGKVSWGTQDTLLVLNGSTTDLGTLTVASSALNLAPGAPTVGTPDWNSTGSQISFTLAAASSNGTTTGYPETYSIYRSTSLLTSDSSSWGDAIATLGDTVTSYTDTASLDKTATYYYKVTAANSFGSASSVSAASEWNNSASLGFTVSAFSVYTVSISNSTITGSSALYYNKSTTFAAGYSGSAASYQWYWDGAAVSGATSSSVTLKASASDSLYTSGNHILMVKVTDTDGDSFSGYSTLAVQYSTTPLEGLVGEWLFKDAASGTAVDTSGNGINGVLSGVTATTDEDGNANSAYAFSGGTRITFESSLIPYNSSTAFSLSLWFKPSSTNNNFYATVIRKFNVTSSLNYEYFVFLRNSEICFGVGDLGLTSYNTISYTIGTWYHAVLTYDGSSSYNFYLNGSWIATGSYSYGSLTSDEKLYLGNVTGQTNYDFAGSMCKLRVYNRVLSASEVLGLSYE